MLSDHSAKILIVIPLFAPEFHKLDKLYGNS
jgi:hypothetical protein